MGFSKTRWIWGVCLLGIACVPHTPPERAKERGSTVVLERRLPCFAHVRVMGPFMNPVANANVIIDGKTAIDAAEAGTYTAGCFDVGSHPFSVSKDGYVPFQGTLVLLEDGNSANNSANLKGLYQLAILVKDQMTGRPVPSAKLNLWGSDWPIPAEEQTDSNGWYVLKDFVGKVRLQPVKAGYEQAPTTEVVVTSHMSTTVTLKGAARFKGAVYDGFYTSPKPLNLATVRVGNREASSDAAGQFSFDGLASDTPLRVEVTFPHFDTLVDWLTLPAGETVKDYRLYGQYTLTGHVRNGAGQAITAQVMLLVPGNTRVFTDAQGLYTFYGVSPQSFPMEVSASGYTTVTEPVDVLESPLVTTKDFVLFAPSTYTVSGFVRNSDGKGIADATVIARTQSGKTRGDGSFNLPGVPGGQNIVVSASKGQCGGGSTMTNLNSNQSVNIKILYRGPPIICQGPCPQMCN